MHEGSRIRLHPFLDAGLNNEQREAVVCTDNCVLAAGAGSGKTFVFSRRFAHLIVDLGFDIDTVLALTFTKKAAAEMYSRIYSTLKKLAESCSAHDYGAKRALKALQNFHKARIQTLDSYCSSLLKSTSRLYGIRPDFKADELQVKEYVEKEALSFTLKHRNNPSLQSLFGVQSFDKTASDFFAAAVLNYSVLARSFSFENYIQKQISTVQSVWNKAVELVDAHLPALAETSEELSLLEILEKNRICGSDICVYTSAVSCCSLPRAEKQQKTKEFCSKITAFAAVLYVFQKKDARIKKNKDSIMALRCSYNSLSAAANYLVHFYDMLQLVPLLKEFESKVNDWKRSSGILSFQDISSVALRVLVEHPDIRCSEKKQLNAIMIDEFQDNNENQRDMLFLLAEKLKRTDRSVPKPEDLCPDKLFFVGDEKQSIYLFRGADVSVFRKLKDELSSKARPLSVNYRSSPDLIAAFNTIFGGLLCASPDSQQLKTKSEAETGHDRLPHSVFLQKQHIAHNAFFPSFEAEYTAVFSPADKQTSVPVQRKTSAAQAAPVHVCLLYNDKTKEAAANAEDENTVIDDTSEKLSAPENEAFFVVSKIASLIESGRYKAKDIAILFRSYSRQPLYEKHLRLQGIPYFSETVTDFFSDAPINDLYYFLRLIVYPQDKNAFAAVLASPFVRLSKPAVYACVATAEKNAALCPRLFCIQNAGDLNMEERACFTQGYELYTRMHKKSGELSCTDMIDELWYNEGYRYETLWAEEGFLFGELYDYVYELACSVDARGESLSSLVKKLAVLAEGKQRLEDMDIPLERNDAVRLIGIHKSKGLEFPVVFICGASAKGHGLSNSEMFYADDQWGLSLNFPPPEDIKECKKNLFFDLTSALAKQKAEAELRRLLYVAFTRAESEVYISGSYSLSESAKQILEARETGIQTEEQSESLRLFTHIDALTDAKRKKNEKDFENASDKFVVNPEFYFSDDTFLMFLFPVISAFFNGTHQCLVKDPPFVLEQIPAFDRSEAKKFTSCKWVLSLAETQKKLIPLYERSIVVQTPALQSRYSSPSKLSLCRSFIKLGADSVGQSRDFQALAMSVAAKDSAAKNEAELLQRFLDVQAGDSSLPAVDKIIDSFAYGEFSYNHFGTIAHAYTEALFTGNPVHIPPETVYALNQGQLKTVCSAAQILAENFNSSDLAQEAKKAVWRKNEYPFKLALEKSFFDAQLTCYGAGGTIVRGKIDLVYEKTDGALVVVDFKTDIQEKPEQHIVQLAIYRRAAALIRGKDFSQVRCCVYYLRSGKVADITVFTEALLRTD